MTRPSIEGKIRHENVISGPGETRDSPMVIDSASVASVQLFFIFARAILGQNVSRCLSCRTDSIIGIRKADTSPITGSMSSENKEHSWSDKPEKEAERTFAKRYPAIRRFLEPLRERLMDRWDQGKYFWELRSCDYWQEFDQPKVVYPDIYEHQSFAWDVEGFYSVNTTYFIPTSEQWLVALSNSTTIEWFYAQISNKIRGGYKRAFSDYMRRVPIPPVSHQQQTEIERLVDRILAAKRGDSSAGVNALEREIDDRVYRLYGLTKEEIKMIEGEGE